MTRTLRLALVLLPALFLLLTSAGLVPVAAAEAAAPPAAKAVATAVPINVNTAGLQELTSLPGVGPALAGRIVEHRKQAGPFRRPEDLLAVKGVGPKLLAKIKDRLTFDAPAAPR
jgi:competence protein ComEA